MDQRPSALSRGGSSLQGHAWSDPAVAPGLAAWAIGVVLTVLSLRLIRLAAKRRTVADYLRWKPGEG
jgi:hypothetical protein